MPWRSRLPDIKVPIIHPHTHGIPFHEAASAAPTSALAVLACILAAARVPPRPHQADGSRPLAALPLQDRGVTARILSGAAVSRGAVRVVRTASATGGRDLTTAMRDLAAQGAPTRRRQRGGMKSRANGFRSGRVASAARRRRVSGVSGPDKASRESSRAISLRGRAAGARGRGHTWSRTDDPRPRRSAR